MAGAALLSLPALPLPWAADESLADPALAEALLALPPGRRPGALVLKPAQLGLARCLTLADAAAARGLGLIVTHSFDGGSRPRRRVCAGRRAAGATLAVRARAAPGLACPPSRSPGCRRRPPRVWAWTSRPSRPELARTAWSKRKRRELRKLTAQRAGVKTVLLPARYEKDLRDVPDTTRSALGFVWLNTVDDAIRAALGGVGAKGPASAFERV